jgi:hypothetical protein
LRFPSFFMTFPSLMISWTLRATTSTSILEEGIRASRTSRCAAELGTGVLGIPVTNHQLLFFSLITGHCRAAARPSTPKNSLPLYTECVYGCAGRIIHPHINPLREWNKDHSPSTSSSHRGRRTEDWFVIGRGRSRKVLHSRRRIGQHAGTRRQKSDGQASRCHAVSLQPHGEDV